MCELVWALPYRFIKCVRMPMEMAVNVLLYLKNIAMRHNEPVSVLGALCSVLCAQNMRLLALLLPYNTESNEKPIQLNVATNVHIFTEHTYLLLRNTMAHAKLKSVHSLITVCGMSCAEARVSKWRECVRMSFCVSVFRVICRIFLVNASFIVRAWHTECCTCVWSRYQLDKFTTTHRHIH